MNGGVQSPRGTSLRVSLGSKPILSVPSNFPVRFIVEKVNGRLFIKEFETGKLVYSPPEWVRSRLQGREPMRQLAEAMTWKSKYDINLIIDFETEYGPKKVFHVREV